MEIQTDSGAGCQSLCTSRPQLPIPRQIHAPSPSTSQTALRASLGIRVAVSLGKRTPFSGRKCSRGNSLEVEELRPPTPALPQGLTHFSGSLCLLRTQCLMPCYATLSPSHAALARLPKCPSNTAITHLSPSHSSRYSSKFPSKC